MNSVGREPFQRAFSAGATGWDLNFYYPCFDSLESWAGLKAQPQFLEKIKDEVENLAIIFIPSDMVMTEFKTVIEDCEKIFGKDILKFYILPVLKLEKGAENFDASALLRRGNFAKYYGGLIGQMFDISSVYIWRKYHSFMERSEKDRSLATSAENLILQKLGTYCSREISAPSENQKKAKKSSWELIDDSDENPFNSGFVDLDGTLMKI